MVRSRFHPDMFGIVLLMGLVEIWTSDEMDITEPGI